MRESAGQLADGVEFLRLRDLLLFEQACRNVAHEAGVLPAFAHAKAADLELGRKLAPVGAARAHALYCARVGMVARMQRQHDFAHRARLGAGLRQDRIVKCAAERGRLGETEDLLGARTPCRDAQFIIEGDEGISR